MITRRLVAILIGSALVALLVSSASAQVVRPAVPRPHPGSVQLPAGEEMSAPPLDPTVPEVRLHILTPQLDFGSVMPGAAPSAMLEAAVDGWDEIRIGLVLPPGQEHVGLTRRDANGAEASIPTTWRLRFSSGSGWTPWLEPIVGSVPETPEPALWWQVGEPGCLHHELQFACEALTAPMQLAGNYGLNVRLMAVPGPGFPGEQGQCGGAGRERTGGRESSGRTEADNLWLRHRRGVTRVAPGPTARWHRRSAAGVAPRVTTRH